MGAASTLRSASELVELIREVVAQELDKRDTVVVYTVYARHDLDDTYDLYMDIEENPTGKKPNLIGGIRNNSSMTYRPGDRVYVMRVRNQSAQSFIIGSASGR